MVIASMKPGMASWFSVTSPAATSVRTTLPPSLYALKLLAADSAEALGGLEWHPANRATPSSEQAIKRRITSLVYNRASNQGDGAGHQAAAATSFIELPPTREPSR